MRSKTANRPHSVGPRAAALLEATSEPRAVEDQDTSFLRSALHRVIDQCEDAELAEVWYSLEGLIRRTDPSLHALLSAPIERTPLSETATAALSQARAEMERGETLPWRAVEAGMFGGVHAVEHRVQSKRG